jgi:hypothetical protein
VAPLSDDRDVHQRTPTNAQIVGWALLTTVLGLFLYTAQVVSAVSAVGAWADGLEGHTSGLSGRETLLLGCAVMVLPYVGWFRLAVKKAASPRSIGTLAGATIVAVAGGLFLVTLAADRIERETVGLAAHKSTICALVGVR